MSKRKLKNELAARASTSDPNYKPMTRPFTIPVEVQEVDGVQMLSCGLRQNHLSGESDDGVKVSMDSGAGCGSPWISGTFEQNGVTRHYRLDAQDLLNAIVKGLLELDAETNDIHPG